MALIDVAFLFIVAGLIVVVYDFLMKRYPAPVVKPKPVMSFRVFKGMKVYKCDLNDPEYLIVEARVKSFSKADGKVYHQVIIEESCIYEMAINAENAMRKMEKRIIESLKK